jgi:hypothetical protein
MVLFREVFAEKVVSYRACRFVWTNPLATIEALEKYYSEDIVIEHCLILKLGDPDSCCPRPTETAIAKTSGDPMGYGSLALTRSIRA